ncbi:MAG TPA: nitroreductase [Caulobacteraceae bacterium]|nr:nitroreductase [Caulobacteraceae bacterium]
MKPTVPPAPAFGEPVEVARPSPDALALMARRRSASAPALIPPAPSTEELHELLRLGARAPDHGKLFPWRFVILEGDAKAALVVQLERLAETQPNPDKAQAVLAKLRNPPLTVAVISRVIECNIPEWEQVLSSGAVCQNLLIAADAMGYGANWITDWYAYDDRATALLGLEPGERVAGFVHLGRLPEPPLERVRPDLDKLVTTWKPQPSGL